MAWNYWQRHDDHSRLMERLAEIAQALDRQEGRSPQERLERLHREMAHFRSRFKDLHDGEAKAWDDEHPLVNEAEEEEDGHAKNSDGNRDAYYNAYFQI